MKMRIAAGTSLTSAVKGWQDAAMPDGKAAR